MNNKAYNLLDFIYKRTRYVTKWQLCAIVFWFFQISHFSYYITGGEFHYILNTIAAIGTTIVFSYIIKFLKKW